MLSLRLTLTISATLCFISGAAATPHTPLWFSLSVDGGPPRYSNQLATLSKWALRSGQGCIRSLRSGEALRVTQLSDSIHAGASCHVTRSRLSGRALLAFGLPLDLNQASIEELTLLRGVGPKLAARIVEGRPWSSIAGLLRLRGVGPKLLKRLSAQLTVTRPPLILLGTPDVR